MYDWKRDLEELLGMAGEATPFTAPIDELQRGDIGGAAGGVASGAFEFLDLPLDFVHQNLGAAIGLANQAAVALPGDIGNEGLARQFAAQGGFGSPEAGSQAWSEFSTGLPMPVQALLEVGLDPTTYMGFGLANRGARGLRAAAASGEIGVDAARNARTVAGGLEGATRVWNDLPDAVVRRTLGPVARPAGRFLKNTVESRFPNAFQLAPESRLKRSMTDISSAFDTYLSNKNARRFLPAVPNSAGKFLAPINMYDADPFFGSELDGVAGAAIKRRAAESLAAIRGQSLPEIPGVNVPGMGPDRPWLQTARATFGSDQFNQFPAQPGEATPHGVGELTDSLKRWVQRQQNMGFVNIPQGGWQDPNLVQIDEDNIRHMANIGAAVMMDLDRTNVGKMFPGLRQAAGMRQASDAIMNEYGRGIEPFTFAAYDEMASAYKAETGKDLPDVRFMGRWGFPQGQVDTARLDRLQAQVDAGKITREDAFAQVMGKDFRKASPQITETGAGMGAGYLSAASPNELSVNPYTGPFAIPGLDPGTGRAAVPETFAQEFQNNRDGYATYMRQLFGDIDEQEMEVLRTMSIEALYDEMMNAAGQFSGGARGATALLDREPGDVVRGDEFTKVGVYGDQPSSIANRAADIPQDLPPGKIGKPSIKQMNTRDYQDVTGRIPDKAEYTRVTGKKAPQTIKESHIREMMDVQGITGYTYNPQGGPLPSVQRLIDAFAVGKDVPVAGKPAKDWYTNAVAEVMNIVGPGRYDDAMMLIDLMAITSAGTGVRDNGRNALKAFAEWKMGSDDFIRTKLGLSADEVDRLLNRQARWVPKRPSETFLKTTKKGDVTEGKKPISFAEDDIFMAEMAASQKQEAGKLFDTYVQRRMSNDQSWVPTQGGPKTNNYAGSFVIKLWQDAVDYAMEGNPLREKIRSALDKAATIYTVDRHDARLSNLATAVTPMGAIVNREQRLIMADKIPDVRPEDIQAGLWYWSKNQQGFLQVDRNDDMAQALREAWNERVDPAKVATIREEIRRQSPGISEEDLSLQADDLMRQEVVFSIVQDELRRSGRDATKQLGSNPVEGLFDLGNDTMGIIARAGRGVTPERKASSALPQLVSTAETDLARIRSGQIYGVTYGFDGRQFVPEEPASGFAVGLGSAGVSQSTGTRKTSARAINQFLSRYGDILDEPGMADKIKFGLFPMDDTGQSASFDLTIIVPDESTAIRIARERDQKAIYDFATGNVIDTGGKGNPRDMRSTELRNIVESVFGKPEVDARRSLRDALARGVTIDEMDAVNPVSILQRKVVNPLMEAYADTSAARFLDVKRSTAAGRAIEGDIEPFDFESIAQNPDLSTQENMILGQTFDDGETYLARMERYHDEGERDIARLGDVIWGPNTPIEKRLEMIPDKATQDMVKQYHKLGIDLRYATPRDLAHLRMAKDMGDAAGVKFDKFTTWDLVRAAWGEQALFSPKYHLGNIQGAWLQNAFGGTFRVGTPTEFLASFKLARGGLEDVEREEALHALHAYQIARKWGFDELPTYLSRGGVRSMTSRDRISGSAVGELTGRVTKNEALGRAVGRPFERNADLSQAIETVMRGSLWSDVLDREMSGAMMVLEDSIAQMAKKQGLVNFEFSILRNINPVPGGPSAARIRQHLESLGFSSGYAERAGRNFAEAKNVAERVARKELDKRQFSYERTNLDEFVGNFIPFHYWISRAVRYYGEEALRHPFVIVNYMRLNEGIEEAQHDPGLSARQKGFLRLMGTPLGFSLLMNPEAMFGVVKIFGLDAYEDPQDTEWSAGKVMNWLKQRGLGLYPWIDGTMNLMGVFGDTFEPDLLGIRHKTLLGSVVNFARSQLGMDPASAPYQTMMGEARWNISNFVSQFTPDWLTQPVPPRAGLNNTEATMDILIESRVVANNPGITNGALLDIMTNPESPQFQTAFQQVASAGVVQQLLNFSLPQNYRMREDTRDVRSRQISTIWEAAEKAGVSPSEFKPTAGDMGFAARYEDLTGNAWKPSDFDDATARRDIINAPPEAKEFVWAESEFYDLGTPEQNRIFDKYQNLRNGNDYQTMGMDELTRRHLADLWVDKFGHAEVIDHVYRLRESYEATHPDFAQYRGWQNSMFDLSNNLGGSLAEYRRQASSQNPNAARYFEDMVQRVHRDYPQHKWESEIERRTTTAEAYLAIIGQPENRYDPGAIPGSIPGDITLPGMALSAQQGYASEPEWVSTLKNMSQNYGVATY